MENPVQDLEFLDFSDINELEKHQLQSVLFAPNTNARYLELPWGGMPALHMVEPPPPPLDWMSHPQYAEGESLVNGGLEDEEEEEPAEQGEEEEGGGGPAPPPQSQQGHGGNGGYTGGDPVAPHATAGPPPTSVATPVPAPVYAAQPFSNVYVNNMTANVSVHGYMTHHPAPGPPPHHHAPGPAFHHVAPPPPMYAPPPAQHAADPAAQPSGPQQQHQTAQKKRYKGNNSSSATSGSGSRRMEQVEVGPHPGVAPPQPMSGGAYPGAPYPPVSAAGSPGGGYYPPTGPYYFPPHGQGGSHLYMPPPPPHHHMYHPHPHGPPPPHQMYPGPTMYQQGPPPPHHGGPHMPPVTQLEESMQQQQYMHHPMEHHHQHHPPGQHPHQPPPPNKHSPHHHQQQQHGTPVPHHPQQQYHPSPQQHQHHQPQPTSNVSAKPQAPPSQPAPHHVESQQAQQYHPVESEGQQQQWEERNGNEEEEEEEGYEEGEEDETQGDQGYEDEAENSPNENDVEETSYQPASQTGSGEPASLPADVSLDAASPVNESDQTQCPLESSSNPEFDGKPDEIIPAGTSPNPEAHHHQPASPAPAPAAEAPIPKTWASLLRKPTDASPAAFGGAAAAGPGQWLSSSPSVNKPLARVEPLTTTSSYSPSGAAYSAGPAAGAGAPQSSVGGAGGGRYSGGARPPAQRHVSDDAASQNLGKLLLNTKLDHKGISLLPRGLNNKSNYCYINATLQALIACPPFYNLLRSINKQRGPVYAPRGHYNAGPEPPTASYPIFNAMLQLANEFSYLQLPPGGGGASAASSSRQRGGRDDQADLKLGAPFTPTYVYQILATIKSDSAFNVEGRQEDAEEFLTFLLNGLNDEMLELLKSVQQSKDSPSEAQEGGKQKGGSRSNGTQPGGAASHAPSSGLSNGDMVNGTDLDGDDGDWKEVTKESKNKGSIVRRHTSVLEQTPVSEIFRGQVRTRVTRVSDSSTTENIQPFFTLALDIEKVNSVKEALDQLVLRDSIEGVTSTKTNQETEAYQTVTIEELPFVLLLHLKCFDYKSDTCHKIQKALEFPVLLSLEPKLLSSGKSKKLGGPPNGPKNKQYKLFAVVYHDGKEASKGHYITDVFHVGYSGWIRYDDANVRFVSDQEVLHPRPPRVPYILYYRRADTIVSKNVSSNS